MPERTIAVVMTLEIADGCPLGLSDLEDEAVVTILPVPGLKLIADSVRIFPSPESLASAVLRKQVKGDAVGSKLTAPGLPPGTDVEAHCPLCGSTKIYDNDLILGLAYLGAGVVGEDGIPDWEYPNGTEICWDACHPWPGEEFYCCGCEQAFSQPRLKIAEKKPC